MYMTVTIYYDYASILVEITLRYLSIPFLRLRLKQNVNGKFDFLICKSIFRLNTIKSNTKNIIQYGYNIIIPRVHSNQKYIFHL